MTRRQLSAALLVIFAVQLFGGMAVAAVCPDPCPDDAEGTRCPPICTLCASCAHALTTTIQHSEIGTPVIAAQRFVPQPPSAPSSLLEHDIFHVPLLG